MTILSIGHSDLFICFVAFIAAGLTLFSGFGLGTILMPAFALFFPVDVAVGATAVVHFSNNVFKVGLVGRQVDWWIVLKFGGPAVLAAVFGAWVLGRLINVPVLYEYQLLSHNFSVSSAKLVIGILLSGFAIMDLLPGLQKIHISPRYLPLGGVLSGFFGGLSGHQGALRSLFLMRLGLSKEVFLGTGVIVACLVDISRLSFYFKTVSSLGNGFNWTSVVLACFSAFLGSYVGSRFIKKVTIGFIQKLVALMLLCISLLLGSGLI